MFQAELYNDNYELVNTPDVNLEIYSDDDVSYNYAFSRTNKSYALGIGQLAPGSYRFRSEVIFNGNQYEASGRFIVREIQYELYELEAQHNILHASEQENRGISRVSP